MPTQRKIFTVQNLTEKIKKTKTLLLADYRGLTVSQMADLRSKIKKAGGELKVVKNRLFSRAAKEAKVKVSEEALEGPTAVLWAGENEIETIKALHLFSQEAGLPKIKFGLFQGEPVSLEKIKTIAQLPGLEALRAKLVGLLHSPPSGLVNVLSGNLRNLVLVLKAKGGEEHG